MRTETPNSRVRKALEECFPSEKMLDVSDIKLLLLEKKGLRYEKDYSEGNLANGLRTLTASNVLKKIERGIYQKSDGNKKIEGVPVKGKISEEVAELEKKKQQVDYLLLEMGEIINGIVLDADMPEHDFERLRRLMAFRKALMAASKDVK